MPAEARLEAVAVTVQLYLLSLSVGPVQDFIAAARRVSDLAAGSHFLIQLTGAVAETFPRAQGPGFGEGLIFPVNPARGGANKILAIVADPRKAVDTAKQEARQTLDELWQRAWAYLPSGQQGYIDRARAEAQLEHFLEIHAAWVPVSESDYFEQRHRVERLLAGRKALRDFEPPPADDAGLFKSPLDPSRPGVFTLPPDPSRPAASAGPQSRVPTKLVGVAPMWLKRTETLDAVSVMKRLLGRKEGDLRAGRVMSTRDLACLTPDPEHVPPKPTDRRDPEDDTVVGDYPYYCVVQADGDHMGRHVDDQPTPEGHRDLSRRLDDFSVAAEQIIRAHQGQPVYCGGDDVLALLPVRTVLACADELRRAFADAIPATATLPAGTLSVGIAVAHYREPLSLALARARQAERLAKETRNACAIILRKRGGQPVSMSQPWDSFTLDQWVALTRAEAVSHGLPFALRTLADHWPDDQTDPEALVGEVKRIVAHSQPALARGAVDLVDQLPALTSVADLRGFVTLLIMAGFFAAGGDR